MNETFWLVGQYRSGKFPDIIWEFQGLFTNEDLAIKACKNSNYFYHKVKVNEELPEETFEFPEVIYPLRDDD